MADCKHEFSQAAMKVLKDGLTDAVQCLKCKASVTMAEMPEVKKGKSKDLDTE